MSSVQSKSYRQATPSLLPFEARISEIYPARATLDQHLPIIEGMGKEKRQLLVLLGAGSSIPRGLPSVAELSRLLSKWANVWAISHQAPDFYLAMASGRLAYYQSSTVQQRMPEPNYEQILGDLAALAHWVAPTPWGDPLSFIVRDGALPADLNPRTDPLGNNGRYALTVLVRDQLTNLLEQLAVHLRSRCRALAGFSSVADQYRAFFQRLRNSFDVGAYNLNYDTVALEACPDMSTGFTAEGTFDPIAVHERIEWNFIYHLHGSVHHCLRSAANPEIFWRNDLDASFRDSQEASPDDQRSNGRYLPSSTLLAGV